jgi:hypothetical protein
VQRLELSRGGDLQEVRVLERFRCVDLDAVATDEQRELVEMERVFRG